MSRFETGWVKLHRDDVFGPIGKRGNEVLGLWSRLLCMATRFESETFESGRFIQRPPGTVITSVKELAGSTDKKDLSRVWRSLKFLESIGKITQQSSTRGRIIFIRNWESIQVYYAEKCPETQPKTRGTSEGKSGGLRSESEGLEEHESARNDNEIPNSDPDEEISRGSCSGDVFPRRDLNGEENEKSVQIQESEGVAPLASTPQEAASARTGPAERISTGPKLVSIISSETGSDSSSVLERGGAAVELQPTPTVLPRRTADPCHIKSFIAAYVSAYQRRYGEKCRPAITGKVVGQVSTLLKHMDVGLACDLIQTYCQMDDSWFLTKAHDLSTFLNNLNKVSNAFSRGSQEQFDWDKVFEMGGGR